jgi:hypothetical protein
MLRRWMNFGSMFVPVGMLIGAVAILSGNALFWLDVLVAYTLVSGLLGSFYIIFGKS